MLRVLPLLPLLPPMPAGRLYACVRVCCCERCRPTAPRRRPVGWLAHPIAFTAGSAPPLSPPPLQLAAAAGRVEPDAGHLRLRRRAAHVGGALLGGAAPGAGGAEGGTRGGRERLLLLLLLEGAGDEGQAAPLPPAAPPWRPAAWPRLALPLALPSHTSTLPPRRALRPAQVTFPSFLSPEEVGHLVRVSRENLERSEVLVEEGEEQQNDIRTSFGFWCALLVCCCEGWAAGAQGAAHGGLVFRGAASCCPAWCSQRQAGAWLRPATGGDGTASLALAPLLLFCPAGQMPTT